MFGPIEALVGCLFYQYTGRSLPPAILHEEDFVANEEDDDRDQEEAASAGKKAAAARGPGAKRKGEPSLVDGRRQLGLLRFDVRYEKRRVVSPPPYKFMYDFCSCVLLYS